MGNVPIPYYVTRQRDGRTKWGYWAPCLARRSKKSGKIEPTLMAILGFKLVDCGPDGPAAWAVAESWNKKWKHALAEHKAGRSVPAPGKIERVYPPNSMGEGFAKFRTTGEWHGKPQSTRDQWMRGWRYIEPTFGDVDPRTVALEDVDLWYNGDPRDPTVVGLVQKNVSEAYLAMKYWRAIYAVLCTINRADDTRYCEGKDPSLGIRRKTPPKRDAIWREGEAVRLVKRAIREGYPGLAAALAVAWDTQFSPVDVRSVTLAKLYPDAAGPIFGLDRAKTGKTALGTLSKRTQRLLWAYIDHLVGTSRVPSKEPRQALEGDAAAGENVTTFKLHQDRPIFHTRGSGTGPKGGRPRAPAVYTKDTLAKDFRVIRALEFPAEEKLHKNKRRKVMDFRRSGAVEAVAGKVDPAALAGKMANSIDTNKTLQDTYLPNQAAVVRLADEARLRGRSALRGTVRPNKEST